MRGLKEALLSFHGTMRLRKMAFHKKITRMSRDNGRGRRFLRVVLLEGGVGFELFR